MAHILNNMGSKYDEQVTIIEGQLDGSFDLEKLKKRIRGYYKRQRNGSSDNGSDDEEEAALIGAFKGRCRKCGKFGHKAAGCRANGGAVGYNNSRREARGPKFAGRCNWCDKPGHMERFCWAKKKGEPKAAGREVANFWATISEDDNGICLLVGDSLSEDKMQDSVWLVDSGASSHMTYSKDGMFDTEVVDENVTLGNNNIVQGVLRGKLKVQLATLEGAVPVILLNVLHVPELCYNLFSVGSVASGGGKVSFNPGTVLIETVRGIKLELPRSKSVTKLFGITCNRCVEKDKALVLKEGIKVNINEAHQLLGHLGYKEMLKTARDFGWVLIGKLQICDSCCKAKGRQKNLPGDDKEKAKYPGERLFIDIASVNKKSIGGAKYWLLVVDDFSRKKWSFFLKNKSELSGTMKDFVQEQRGLGYDVKHIRLDNAGENKSFAKESKAEGLGLTLSIQHLKPLSKMVW